ncbi:NAD-glutamate dehydrogenase [Sediminivirga luteola]|uniref:NAD-glutamate dehydrogenase n=1 Tax=Sediminivirga luteola TaxID=1774748 RepID=UPI001E590EA2|nr:NAD-glutamate dehydrogenase [Sediminivirga luteola]
MEAIERSWIELEGPEGSGPPENFLRSYYAHLDPEDRELLSAGDLARIAREHYAVGAMRTGDEAVVRLSNAEPGTEGHGAGRTSVHIVSEDMPYLVSSIVADLSQLGFSIHTVIHPILAVDRRGEKPGFLDTADESSLESGSDTSTMPILPDLGGAQVESWIHIEIDRIGEDEFAPVQHSLLDTLAQVAAANRDQSAMRHRAREIAQELETGAPLPELAEEAEQAARLLRWLRQNFLFLGFKEYDLVAGDQGDYLQPVEGTSLGIMSLRRDQRTLPGTLTYEVERRAREKHVLVLTKANSRSQVYRNAYMDYIGVKRFNARGEVVGERRFIGLFSSRAYASSVMDVPLLDRKAEQVIERSGFAKHSHSGQNLISILETLPRDDFFQASTEEIGEVAMQVVDLQERRRSRVFTRRDPYQRFISVIVYVPRDLYDTAARLRVERVLRESCQAEWVDFDVLLTHSALARLHFVARVERGVQLPELAPGELEERILAALRSWSEDVAEFLNPSNRISRPDEARRASLWARAFPPGYQQFYSPRDAVGDIAWLEKAAATDEPQVRLHEPAAAHGLPEEGKHALRFSFYRTEPLSLAQVIPYLSNLGAEIVDEKPFELSLSDGTTRYIYDFGLQFDRPLGRQDRAHLENAFRDLWTGQAETGRLDRLVIAAGLAPREVVLLRACVRYLRQLGLSYSDRFIGDVLADHPELTRGIVEYFRLRFDPALEEDLDARTTRSEEHAAALRERLDEVRSLDADRIMRQLIELIAGVLRTNFYQRDEQGRPTPHIALKTAPVRLSFAPKPRPEFEIFVYSPRVEGVHLRFGKVARGGLRWSDRREDFRTEVLGLVKAQAVKNALIVPAGAKGGFYCKQLPPASDREAWLAEGRACYSTFIGALLDVTDNRVYVDGVQETRHPRDVVRYDDEDSYLVVAADKGTATFSDLANSIAGERGFWLGDAFASGGSVGYDHKAMAITSRGAWESVKRHFRELGTDVQSEDFTVVGIGDMSGDVFGNGMLRSRHIKLVAAFDHRDVFIDPDPDPEVSYAERERLFRLPRSSWQDYDRALISAGGGVYSRQAKSVDLSEQAARVLGVEPGRRTPQQLISELLAAPVDLLYNGGIGTYVKASSESHAEVGDKANDGIRIDGAQLRAKVVGEGGNLGLTQLGRIEAALAGVRLNTDAVDNSAGVDCSDHEVNIKLFLGHLLVTGELNREDRDELLLGMTDEVAEKVLAHNYRQNVLLGEARIQTTVMSPTYLRMQRQLERTAGLDSAVEFLPDRREISRRLANGQGFTSPELAVLMAYVKMNAADELLASSVPDEPWAQALLEEYFPRTLVQRYGHRLTEHPLRREIIVSVLVNRMVDSGGLTYVYRLQEETAASLPAIARAFTVATEVFTLADYRHSIEALDNAVPTETQVDMQLEYVRLLDRASRWFVTQAPGGLDVAAASERFGPAVHGLAPRIPELLRGLEREVLQRRSGELRERGVPETLAVRTAALLDEFPLLDIVEAAEACGEDPLVTAQLYYAASDRFRAAEVLGLIGRLERSDRWTALARGALREDFYLELAHIVQAALAATDSDQDADERLRDWEAGSQEGVAQALETLDEVIEAEAGIASVTVLLRRLRSIARAAAAPSAGASA